MAYRTRIHIRYVSDTRYVASCKYPYNLDSGFTVNVALPSAFQQSTRQRIFFFEKSLLSLAGQSAKKIIF